MSHSMWYQVTSMLTEQAIDLMNGDAKPPALGCMQHKPGDKNQRFGKNGGNRFGEDRPPMLTGDGPQQMLGSRRVLLDRFLQPKPQ